MQCVWNKIRKKLKGFTHRYLHQESEDALHLEGNIVRGNKVGRSRVDCIIREVSERVYLVDVGEIHHELCTRCTNAELGGTNWNPFHQPVKSP